MSTIGERIAKRRIELGLSQEELASKLGYASRSGINKIENGKNAFPQKKLPAFAAALRCSVNYLTGTENEMDASAREGELDAYLLMDPDLKPMMRKFVALPEDKKQAVKEFVDKLFNEFFNGED